MNMNAYTSQAPSRQTSRIQNTQKSGLGNGSGGWGGFAVPSSGSGFGGALGGTPGLGGQARPAHLSGFAQVMGGGSEQGPINMNDFPSLSNPQRTQQSQSNTAGWNSSAIRQPSTQQSQPHQLQQRAPSTAPSQQSVDHFDGQRSQHHSGDRTASGEEFPPLGGQMNGDSLGPSNGFSDGYGSPDIHTPRANGQQSQLPIRESSSTFSSTHPSISQSQSQLQMQSSQNSQAQSTPGIKRYADMSESAKWGLPGLLAAFEARKQAESGGPVDETLPGTMRSPIYFGHDLNSLGMDLESPEPLYPTFTPFQAAGSTGSSSFDFHDRHVVPHFTLPAAYTVSNVPPLSSRMSAFSDGQVLPQNISEQHLANEATETLFNIFYQSPQDVLQELASHELITREWRWHKVLRQWMQKDTRDTNSGSALPLVDLTNGAPIGAQPIRKSERMEHGVYMFFDAMHWRRERRYLDLDYESLDPPRLAAINASGPGLAGPGRLMTDGNQQGGVGSSQIPSA